MTTGGVAPKATSGARTRSPGLRLPVPCAGGTGAGARRHRRSRIRGSRRRLAVEEPGRKSEQQHVMPAGGVAGSRPPRVSAPHPQGSRRVQAARRGGRPAASRGVVLVALDELAAAARGRTPRRSSGGADRRDAAATDLLEDPVGRLLVVAAVDPIPQILLQPDRLALQIDVAQLHGSVQFVRVIHVEHD